MVTAAAACLPNPETVNKLRADAHQKEMAQETDPDVRAWSQGYYDCTTYSTDFSHERLERMSKCIADNEAKTVASLKTQATSETRPSMKQALAAAARCIEGARKVDVEGMPKYGQYPDVKACLDDKRRASTKDAREDDDDFATAEKADSVDAWLSFIEKHKGDKRSAQAAKRVIAASSRETGDAQWAIDDKLASVYPEGVAELPADRRILLAGPKGLRVRDLVKLNDAKVSPSIVVARVKASPEPYKSFDGEELGALKRLGVADEVVAAMIEVTTKLQEKKKSDEERQAMRAELAALRKMIEDKKSAGGAGGGEVVQTKDGPLDVIASCGKRLAAMDLCEKAPFPASTICKSSAESSFPCPNH